MGSHPDGDRSWHTDGMPELRDGPPWVMEQMIALQPGLVASILSAPAADEIAADAVAAARAGEPVVVLGCGTSQHGAMAIAELVEDALTRAGHPARHGVEARDAFEALLAPRAAGVAIGVSHDGATPATNRALAAAREADARTYAITYAAHGEIARGTRAVLATPAHDDSWCHTIAYTSAILAGTAIAEAIAPARLEAAVVERRLTELIETLREGAAAVARSLAPAAHLVTAGSGVDRATARELALKVEEGARRPCAQRDLETLLHGHLVACDGTAGLVLFALDRRNRPTRLERVVLAAQAAATLGIRTALVVDGAADDRLAALPDPASRLVADSGPDPPGVAGSLLAGAVAAQLLALELTHEAGTNPDLIRREERAWREAAALLEDGDRW